jgi:hypothetical protein
MLKDAIVDEISMMLLVVHWWYLFLSVLQTLLGKRDNALQRIINMLMFSYLLFVVKGEPEGRHPQDTIVSDLSPNQCPKNEIPRPAFPPPTPHACLSVKLACPNLLGGVKKAP